MNIWKRQHHDKHHPPRQPWEDDEPQGYNPRPCPVCNGKRKTPCTVQDETGKLVEVLDWCAACGGTGEA